MAVFAVCMPIVMLGVLLALGRYEELLLPKSASHDRQAPVIHAPAVEAHAHKGGE
jgi:hypothetical protein